MFKDLLEVLHIDLTVGVIGALTAFISAKLEGVKGIWNYMFRVFVGFISTTYLTPLVQNYYDLDNNVAFGIAFILGLVSMNLIIGIKKISEQFKINPKEIINKIFTK